MASVASVPLTNKDVSSANKIKEATSRQLEVQQEEVHEHWLKMRSLTYNGKIFPGKSDKQWIAGKH